MDAQEPMYSVSVRLTEGFGQLLAALRKAAFDAGLFPRIPSVSETLRWAVEQACFQTLTQAEMERFTWRDGRFVAVKEPKEPRRGRGKR